MFFSVFFFFAWLFAAIFYYQKKVLSKTENLIIFLIMLVVSIHWNWIIYEELVLVKISNTTQAYTTLLLFRTLIAPLAANIYINIILISTARLKTIFVTLGGAICLFAFILLALAGGLITTEHWNLSLDYIYFVLFLCGTLVIHYFYQSIVQKEGKTL